MNVLRSVLQKKDRRDFPLEPMKQHEFKEKPKFKGNFLKKAERLKPPEEKVRGAENVQAELKSI